MPNLTMREKSTALLSPGFSCLLRHPARKRYGSILGHKTHAYIYLLTYFPRTHRAVASLEWVTPGAATESVTPIFSWKKPTTFFTHHRLPVLLCHPYLFSPKNWRPILYFFCSSLSLYRFHSGVTPCRVSPRAFLPIRPRLSTILCKYGYEFFSFSCHPPWGRSVPPSYATGPHDLQANKCIFIPFLYSQINSTY